jgi:chromate transporter
VTPGPLFTTATFIGYLLAVKEGGVAAGLAGALIATIAIFLPSFLFITIAGPIVARVRKTPVAGSFLDGVNAASLALMASVTWQLGRATIYDFTTALVAITAAILLLRFRVNSAWLVLAAAATGFVIQAARARF